MTGFKRSACDKCEAVFQVPMSRYKRADPPPWRCTACGQLAVHPRERKRKPTAATPRDGET